MRMAGFAAVLVVAAMAGIMESSSGSDIAMPAPRRNVRRSRAFFVIIMTIGFSSSETADS